MSAQAIFTCSYFCGGYNMYPNCLGIYVYHIPLNPEVYGSKVEVRLETGKPLSLCEVTVLSDGTTETAKKDNDS